MRSLFYKVKHLMDNRIYHGDIKPENITIVSEYSKEQDEYVLEPKLIDFGCCSFHYNEFNGMTPFYFPPHPNGEDKYNNKQITK